MLRDLAVPFTSFISRVPSFVAKALRDDTELMDENTQIAIELQRLRYELSQIKMLKRENQQLRDLMGLSGHITNRLVASRVIARDINGWWQMARLNKGSKDGIATDMPVIAAEGLVGRIIGVSARTSDILFPVDPSCKISARLSRLDAFGIVRGKGVSLRGDAQCRMDFILKEHDIIPGDEVMTSGLGGVYPAGLVIGYVEHAYLDRSGLYQYADIVPAVDLRSLNMVLIVVSPRRSKE